MQYDRDYYGILGVPRDAPEAEIRRAFRALAKELHPDSKPAGRDPASEGDFRALTQAYETLKDPARRSAYDEELNSARQLASRGGNKSRSPRTFAAGLAMGFLFAIAALGAKIYLDRADARVDAIKSQESLRIQNDVEAVSVTVSSNTGPEETAQITDAGAQTVPPSQTGAVNTVAEDTPPPSPAQAPADSTQTAALEQPVEPPPQKAEEAVGIPAESLITPEQPANLGHLNAPETQETGGQTLAPAHSAFAEVVLEQEHSLGSGEEAAADRLVAFVNSSSSIGDLSEAAALASKRETRDLITKRIVDLKDEQDRQAARERLRVASLQDRGRQSYEGGDHIIEFAAGPKANEAIIRLGPGNGLHESFADCEFCPEMVIIPSGQGVMGSRPERAGYRMEEVPAHKINMHKPLAVSKFGVSAGNWRACVDAGACRPTLSSFLAIGRRVPATRVSWFDAKDYVQWLSNITGRRYRLLTEAEWEYAAHAPAGQAADKGGARIAARKDTGGLRFGTGYKTLGASTPNAWGLHGMPGNAQEWVEDCWHGTYDEAPSDGTAWLSAGGGDCAYRVVL
ncbi:MAG: SUMF1/EgtB/PvdO family nonheme iron enzyme, partial [Rhodomicrobium sp.]|nr:SUMF1/EgtB/PvdO family nonheme iron enzyme [Rhodomicrobium sp.]